MVSMLLPIQPGTLPPGVCYANEQDRLNGFAAVMDAVLSSGLAFYNYGDTVPAAENRGYPWLNTNTGLWYIYSGAWYSPRPVIEQDSGYRILWSGSSADVPTISGGTAGIPTDKTGPFWDIDHAFDGRSPMGPGDIPNANPAKNLSNGEAYGSGSQAILQTNLPNLSLRLPYFVGDDSSGGKYLTAPHNTNSTNANADVQPSPLGDGEALSIVPPVVGIWFLKPTIRRFYSIAG